MGSMTNEGQTKASKSLGITLRLWFDEDDGSIHIASPDANFISTVNAKPESVRSHPHLFAHLAATLRKAGLPAPPDAEN